MEDTTQCTDEQFTKEELVQILANAYKTNARCGGHNKASMNQSIMTICIKKLHEMGAEIPDDETLSKIGVFNGKGSY